MIFNQMFDLIIPAAHRPAPRRHSLTIPIVKLRRGSGKDRQGMAVKAKGLKA